MRRRTTRTSSGAANFPLPPQLLWMFGRILLLYGILSTESYCVNSFVFSNPTVGVQQQQRGNVKFYRTVSCKNVAASEESVSSTSISSITNTDTTMMDTQGNSTLSNTSTSNSTSTTLSNNNTTFSNTTTAATAGSTNTTTTNTTTTSTTSIGFQKPSALFTNKMRSSLIENLLLINTTRPIHYKDATIKHDPSSSSSKNNQGNDNDNNNGTTILVVRPPMLNDVFPNLIGSTQNTDEFDLYEYLNNGSNDSDGISWAVVFMHPGDFTPVCTTELGQAALMQAEFDKRDVKLVGFSCNDANAHRKWLEDVQVVTGGKVTFPLFCDDNRQMATRLGILDATNSDTNSGLPLTVRSVYILKPDKTIALMMTYPASTGRNMKELLRCIDAVQLTYVSQVSTPVNWKRGDECLVEYLLNDEEADQVFGVDGYRIIKVPSEAGFLGSSSARLPRHYMRYTKDPSAGFVRRMIQRLLQQPKPPK